VSIEFPYRWNDRDGRVEVEVRPNEDPVAVGCPEYARGFPVCTATVEHPAIGYSDMLGWVQLLDRSDTEAGFEIDALELVTEVSHPFAYFGPAQTLFDAPHVDILEEWDFHAHSFLCGRGGELHPRRFEVRAVLGFGWGFSKRGSRIEWFGPEPLTVQDWDGHLPYLTQQFTLWQFAPGFHQHPLRG
jgi:hypothetical protein